MQNQLTNAEDIVKFILAGKAVFTIKDTIRNKHYTYRVNKKEGNYGTPIYFVNLGISYEDSVYLGMLDVHPSGDMRVRLTQKSRVSEESQSYTILNEVVGWLYQWDDLPHGITFYHEGKCCVCGRPLTNPESIEAGIGPECRGKL